MEKRDYKKYRILDSDVEALLKGDFTANQSKKVPSKAEARDTKQIVHESRERNQNTSHEEMISQSTAKHENSTIEKEDETVIKPTLNNPMQDEILKRRLEEIRLASSMEANTFDSTINNSMHEEHTINQFSYAEDENQARHNQDLNCVEHKGHKNKNIIVEPSAEWGKRIVQTINIINRWVVGIRRRLKLDLKEYYPPKEISYEEFHNNSTTGMYLISVIATVPIVFFIPLIDSYLNKKGIHRHQFDKEDTSNDKVKYSSIISEVDDKYSYKKFLTPNQKSRSNYEKINRPDNLGSTSRHHNVGDTDKEIKTVYQEQKEINQSKIKLEKDIADTPNHINSEVTIKQQEYTEEEIRGIISDDTSFEAYKQHEQKEYRNGASKWMARILKLILFCMLLPLIATFISLIGMIIFGIGVGFIGALAGGFIVLFITCLHASSITATTLALGISASIMFLSAAGIAWTMVRGVCSWTFRWMRRLIRRVF